MEPGIIPHHPLAQQVHYSAINPQLNPAPSTLTEADITRGTCSSSNAESSAARVSGEKPPSGKHGSPRCIFNRGVHQEIIDK